MRTGRWVPSNPSWHVFIMIRWTDWNGQLELPYLHLTYCHSLLYEHSNVSKYAFFQYRRKAIHSPFPFHSLPSLTRFWTRNCWSGLYSCNREQISSFSNLMHPKKRRKRGIPRIDAISRIHKQSVWMRPNWHGLWQTLSGILALSHVWERTGQQGRIRLCTNKMIFWVWFLEGGKEWNTYSNSGRNDDWHDEN